MAPNTKETIVNAYLTLLEEKNLDKISVTDLVEACDISRQTFYYHFDGIDAMLDWAIKTETEKALVQAKDCRSWCEALYCLVPMLEKFNNLIVSAIDSSHLYYVEKLLSYYTYTFTKEFQSSKNLIGDVPTDNQTFLLKYLSSAIVGLIYMEMQYDKNFSYKKIFDQIARLFANTKK